MLELAKRVSNHSLSHTIRLRHSGCDPNFIDDQTTDKNEAARKTVATAREKGRRGDETDQLEGAGPVNNYRNWVELLEIIIRWPARASRRLGGKLVAITNTETIGPSRCQIPTNVPE